MVESGNVDAADHQFFSANDFQTGLRVYVDRVVETEDIDQGFTDGKFARC